MTVILSAFVGHDAAVAIVKDGELLINLELERHSRIRHDGGILSSEFLDHCLERAGIRRDEIDVFASGRAQLVPIGQSTVNSRINLWGRDVTHIAVHHHLAHAASSYFTSPFEDATILTYDAGGDNASWSISRAVGGFMREIRMEARNSYGNSWASLSGMTFKLSEGGLVTTIENKAGFGEGKLMALAAYGKPNPVLRNSVLAELERLARNPYDPFNHGEDLSDYRSQRAQDIAHEIQLLTNDHIKTLMLEAHHAYQEQSNLCYAGGLALNCVANSIAFQRSGFKRLHVPPCPNDSGLALGQALFVHYSVCNNKYHPKQFSPYTGPCYSAEEWRTAVAHAIDDGSVAEPEAATPERVGDLLESGKILCVARGRSESGPRALGHRSFLVRPDLPGVRDRMNQIKRREWFRPFAPIVLSEYAPDIMDKVIDHSWYMTTSGTIRPEWRDRLAGVAHVDYSTRPQVLERQMEPFLYDCIDAFRKLTGIPAVLNTSFNVKEPLVETPAQAVATFLNCGAEWLLLDDMLVRKRDHAV